MELDTQVAATRPVVSAPLQTIERSPLRGYHLFCCWIWPREMSKLQRPLRGRRQTSVCRHTANFDKL